MHESYHIVNQTDKEYYNHYFVYQQAPRTRTILTLDEFKPQPVKFDLPWSVLIVRIDETRDYSYLNSIKMGVRNQQLYSIWSWVREHELAYDFSICLGSAMRNHKTPEEAAIYGADFFWRAISAPARMPRRKPKCRPLHMLF